jgi:GT2 family glycosyltransferase
MISVLLATTGRPDMAEAFVQNLKDTTEGHHVELVAAVDVDPETRNRVVVAGAGLRRMVLDYSETYRGCSRAWNDALARSTGDPVVLAADDLVFEPGWLDAALARLAEFEDGWGFVGFNDGHMGAELSTHYLVSRRMIVEEFGGVIAWECYRHSFNDCEANARAQRAGRYAWCEDAVVRHRHWIFGDRAQDTTDARNHVAHSESQQHFARRAANDFPNDYEAVII